MVNEYTSAGVFEGLAAQLRSAPMADYGLDGEALAKECDGFAAEERHHGVLCGAVVEALGGQACAPRPARDPYPAHADATPIESVLRNALSIGCLSETVAVALIGAERLDMPEGALRDLLTTIYADEVGHARFSWRLVASVVPQLDAETKQRLSRYLIVALAHLEQHELAHLPLGFEPPAGGECLGLCSGTSARGLLYDAIRQVILPGLEAAGLEAERAWCSRASAGIAA